jgi:hypothetical protein
LVLKKVDCDDSSSLAANLSEGIEYLLGIRKEISAQAAAAINSLSSNREVIKAIVAGLKEVVQDNLVVDVDAKMIVCHAGRNEIFDDKQPPHIKASLRPEGFDFMPPPGNLGTLLKITPEATQNMTKQIGRLPVLLDKMLGVTVDAPSVPVLS